MRSYSLILLLFVFGCNEEVTVSSVSTIQEEVIDYTPIQLGTRCDKYIDLFKDSENPSWFLGQAEQESSCNPLAKSPYAEGLMQFTPKTAEWASNSFCRQLGKARITDAYWSAKCGVIYMGWLADRVPTTGRYCDTLYNASRAYNGGLGWIQREAKLTDIDSAVELILVCRDTGRADWACKENTKYPHYISQRQRKYTIIGGMRC